MSSVEPETREDRERAAIVARYDRGHAPGAAIDAWEDPKLELYHVTDRYGFIQYVLSNGNANHTCHVYSFTPAG